MWTKWDPRQLSRDFAVIASLHANAVRIIVPPAAFGYPTPSSTMLARLSQAIQLAAAHGLKSELTLFDGWNGFSDIAGSKTWASSIVAPYRDDQRIAYIDLHNEIAADTNAAAADWAAVMVPYAKSAAGDVPVTVSTSVSSNVSPLTALVAKFAKAPPDLYDVHFYGKVDHAYDTLAQAKRLAGATPLFVGETGFATDPSYRWAPAGQSDATSLEAYQRFYLQMVEAATSALSLPPAAPWILYDFKPGAMNPGSTMPPYEYHFGLVRTDGTLKPAGRFIRQYFATLHVDASINNGFELLNSSMTHPVDWKLWLPTLASFGVDRAGAHSGGVSARITGARGDSLGCPAYYIYPIVSVVPGATYSASAWARGTNATGSSSVVLAWFDARDRFLGVDQSVNLPPGTTSWKQLTVSAKAPTQAAAVELHLQVCNNAGTTWWDDVNVQGSAPAFSAQALVRSPVGSSARPKTQRYRQVTRVPF